MKTLSISTETLGVPLDATHFLALTSNFPNPFTGAPNGPVKIMAIEGYCGGTVGTNYWIQVLSGVPGAALPMYSMLVIGGAAFSFVYPQGLDTANMSNGLGVGFGQNVIKPYLAISSTDGTYTNVAAPTNARVDIEMSYQLPQNMSQANGNNVGALTVYADPNSTNKLVAFVVVNNTGADAYLMLYAYANPANGSIPVEQWKVLNGATFSTTLGDTGFVFQQGKPDYTNHTGCYLIGSSTTQFLTASANGWNMYAWFI